MERIAVSALRTFVLPQHHKVFAREISGPGQGNQKFAFLHNIMLVDGGAEMHTHPDSDHVFFVIKGEMLVDNGREKLVVAGGEALYVPPGEPHQVTSNGRVDCEYLVMTAPPAKFKE